MMRSAFDRVLSDNFANTAAGRHLPYQAHALPLEANRVQRVMIAFPCLNVHRKRVPAATAWLLANIPSSISLEEDEYQGRWRILCDSGSCKSVAWSRRGLPHACDLVLYHSWNMHTPHTGEELHWA